MTLLRCPHFGGVVELSEARKQHIRERHPDLFPLYWKLLQMTLEDPDQIRISLRDPNARLLSRWYDEVLGGKYVVAVVTRTASLQLQVITAYLARKLAGGEVEWQRN